MHYIDCSCAPGCRKRQEVARSWKAAHAEMDKKTNRAKREEQVEVIRLARALGLIG